MRVLGIAGSLRRGSYNSLLIAAAADFSLPEMLVVPYEGLASIPLFDEDLEMATDGGPEPVRRLRREVSETDGILFATPEYNWSIPGVLKNAIDWLSRPAPAEVLVAKPVAVIGATRGRWGTRLSQNALRQVLCATESIVLPAPALYLGEAGTAFDSAGRLTDEGARDQLTSLLSAFATWIDAAASRRRAAPLQI